jgi:hypothetical protein
LILATGHLKCVNTKSRPVKKKKEKLPHSATIQNEGKGYSPKLKRPKM